MKLLLLGGTTEARRLAEALAANGHQVIYSLAGRTPDSPSLPCPVRRGGFGGVAGLVDYLRREAIEGIVDATHPFAVTIQHHAVEAARRCALPLWRWHRPPWRPAPGDRWREFPEPAMLLAGLAEYRRILFTVGASAYAWLEHRHNDQQWFIRALHHPRPLPRGAHPVDGRGPFTVEAERALLRRIRPQVMVSKHSGGAAVAAKLQAAREAGIPVFLLARPTPVGGEPIHTVNELLTAINHRSDEERLDTTWMGPDSRW